MKPNESVMSALHELQERETRFKQRETITIIGIVLLLAGLFTDERAAFLSGDLLLIVSAGMTLINKR